ncbi:MAG: hypothetical protein OXQ93_16455 [Gemmatimonadota bacterium]|nr:hypothetical protein [Gemmatimonadota bacterium]
MAKWIQWTNDDSLWNEDKQAGSYSCRQVRKAVENALDADTFYIGRSTEAEGEHWPPAKYRETLGPKAHRTLIDTIAHDAGGSYGYTQKKIYETILHEAMHHQYPGVSHSDYQYELHKCHDRAASEDDDDDDGGGGGGGGGTEWIPGETCTTQMVWVEKWRPCSGNGGGGGGSSCTWAVQYCTVPTVSACTEKYYELEEKVTCS